MTRVGDERLAEMLAAAEKATPVAAERAALRLAADRAERAEALSRTGAVKVKALGDWRRGYCDDEVTIEQASTGFGSIYQVRIFEGTIWLDYPVREKEAFPTVEAAKAAAQADYEARIRSALEPAAPEGGQDAVAYGEDIGGKIVSVRLDKSRHCTVPLYTRPAEQAVTEPMGWQPIDTAPRDGTRVDLWQQGHRFTDAFWDEGEEWWCIDSLYSDGEPCPLAVSPEPTHWMPLPAPPKAGD